MSKQNICTTEKEIRDLAPWFTPFCLNEFEFLTNDYEFNVSGRTIAYETMVTYTWDGIEVRITCEVGFFPRIFINKKGIITKLADSSFRKKLKKLQEQPQFDPYDSKYHEIMREILSHYARMIEEHDSVLKPAKPSTKKGKRKSK